MLSFDKARAAAESCLPAICEAFGVDDIILADKFIRERQRGWVFPYNRPRYMETEDPIDGLVGNGPIFVDKFSAEAFLMRSGPWKTALDEYDRTGVMPERNQAMKWTGNGPPLPFPIRPL